ncbi:leucine--tRNA ligase [Patescibacteria group bacterium]|nr:leucine--tRNA ligase [Patescibacteria group bacterium]
MTKYDPAKIEGKWREEWEKTGLYQAIDFDKKPKYYALTEFPYPSGEGLHMGHVFSYGTPDIFARKKRMERFNVLFPIGWDAFGLPTENYAVKTGIQPVVVTKNNTDRFREQMKSLGLSFDWSREINTTDPNYYKWTQWIFTQLFKNGLAYKSETPVGWCPSCKIILANEEIVNGKCERCGTVAQQRKQSQWVLRITSYADRLDKELDLVDYPDMVKASQRNWIGRKEGAKISFKIQDTRNKTHEIMIFTTRPDTIYGATFIVLAPEHPLAIELAKTDQKIADYIKTVNREEVSLVKTGVETELKAVNPASDKEIPVWVSDYVLAEAGTGAIMGVPAHDERDYEFAGKFNLPIIRVVTGPDGSNAPINQVSEVFTGTGEMINSDDYNGLESPVAFEKIVEDLKKRGLATFSTTYHLRDWIFSRQHYWGEPIPMVYCEKCAKGGISWWDTKEGKAFKPLFNPLEPEHFDSRGVLVNLAGWFPVPESKLPVTLPEVEYYQPTDTGESPLAKIKNWVEVACPECGGPARRETDTMPNWAGSSWYYLRFSDPTAKTELADPKKLNYWQPVDVYFGGAEHNTLHLLYSRFWHKFLNDLGRVPGKEPYKARRQHGLILAEDGTKMSKSKGNVINPDQMVSKYGADAVRTFLSFVGPYDQTLPWSTAGVEGVRRFLNRVWTIYQNDQKIANSSSPELIAKLNWAIKRTGEGIDNLKQNTGVAALMEFLNLWEKTGALSREDAGKFLRLLAPFAPFLAEELWQRYVAGPVPLYPSRQCSPEELRAVGSPSKRATRIKKIKSIHLEPWPEVEEGGLEEKEATIAISINGKTRATLQISAPQAQALDEARVVAMAKSVEKIAEYLKGKSIKRTVYVPGKILNFVV